MTIGCKLCEREGRRREAALPLVGDASEIPRGWPCTGHPLSSAGRIAVLLAAG